MDGQSLNDPSPSSPLMGITTEPQEQREGVQLSEAEFATNLINKPCFHQWTTYDSPSDGRSLRVSFSTTSNFGNADNMPTILYFGPLVCSRYFLCTIDSLACLKGVRVIFIERPGFGSSAPVLLDQRMSHTLASIPSVLSYLRINHVAVLSASAGTIYSLNFLGAPSLRQFLHPQHPYAAALVPWVHPKFSKTRLLATAAALPEALIGSFGTVVKTVGVSIIPSSNWSSGALASLVSAFSNVKVENDTDEHNSQFGIDKRRFEKLNQLALQRVWKEDTSGLGTESLLLTQKNLPPSSWGHAASYPEFVNKLRDSELRDLQQSPTPVMESVQVQPHRARSRLRFRTFFATSDIMIGETGRRYFDACFKECEGLDEAVEYTSSIVKDANHDSVMDIRKGAIGAVFDDVKESWIVS